MNQRAVFPSAHSLLAAPTLDLDSCGSCDPGILRWFVLPHPACWCAEAHLKEVTRNARDQ